MNVHSKRSGVGLPVKPLRANPNQETKTETNSDSGSDSEVKSYNPRYTYTPSPTMLPLPEMTQEDISDLMKDFKMPSTVPIKQALEQLLDKNATLSEEEKETLQAYSLYLRLQINADPELINRLHTSMGSNTSIDASSASSSLSVNLTPDPITIIPTINMYVLLNFREQLRQASAEGRVLSPLINTIEEWKTKPLKEEQLKTRPDFINEKLSYIDDHATPQTYETAFVRIQLLREELKSQGKTNEEIEREDMVRIRLEHPIMDGSSRRFISAGTAHLEHAEAYTLIKNRLKSLFKVLNNHPIVRASFEKSYKNQGIYIKQGGRILPSKYLVHMLFNAQGNSYFMDGLANILKGDKELITFLETDERYKKNFALYISNHQSDKIRDLIDDSQLIPVFKIPSENDYESRFSFNNKGIGEGIRAYLHQSEDFINQILDLEQDSDRKMDLYYFARDILEDYRVDDQDKATINRLGSLAMETGSTQDRNELKLALIHIRQTKQIQTPSPTKQRIARILDLSVSKPPNTHIARLEQKELELSEASRENQALQSTISDLTQANDAKDSQISTLKQEVGALRDDNAAKDGRISLLEQEVGSLRDDNAAMKQEVGALRDDNAAMKQEVTQLKELVQQLLQQK